MNKKRKDNNRLQRAEKNDHSRVMEQSLKHMRESSEQQAQQKLQNLFELFPHVDCDQVRDIFDGVEKNIGVAAETLKAIYGEAPEDLSEQFKEIEGVVD